MQAQKIKLLRQGGSPLAFTQLAGVIGVGDTEFTRESVDDTLMDQESDWMEKVAAALIDPGELELTLKFDTTADSENQLYQDFKSGANETYRLQLPEGSPNETITFTGFISSFGNTLPATDRAERSVTFTISGKPTLSWASPQ